MLEPGKAAKTDKASIITDAIRIVTQLRAENGQLRQLNKFLEVFYFWPPANLLEIKNFPFCCWPVLHCSALSRRLLPRAWATCGVAMCLRADVFCALCSTIDLIP